MMLEYLSQNIITIINRSLYNKNREDNFERQVVSQLIKHDIQNPFSKPLLSESEAKGLFLNRVHPYPAENFTDEARTELRVYFPETDFIGGTVVEDTTVVFDIICHSSLYMIKDSDNNTLVRPHIIAKYLIDFFDEYTFSDTVGKLKFKRVLNLPYDNGFQCTRLVARMTTFGKKD